MRILNGNYRDLTPSARVLNGNYRDLTPSVVWASKRIGKCAF